MTGLILAGGRSSRFGSDKALYSFPDQKGYALSHTLSLLNSLPGVSSTAVSCRPEQIPLLQKLVKARFIVDHPQEQNKGPTPLRGIVAALEALEDSLLILPCDTPLMRADVMKALLEKRESHATSETLRTVFIHETGIIEPLIAVYEKESLPFLKKALQEGHWSLYSVIPHARQILVPCPDETAFFNMNTPEDRDTIAALKEGF